MFLFSDALNNTSTSFRHIMVNTGGGVGWGGGGLIATNLLFLIWIKY